MGGGIEGDRGNDRLQASDYAGVSVKGREVAEKTDYLTGRTSLEDAECI